MDRRQVIKSLSLITSHAMYPAVLTSFVASCQNETEVQEGYLPSFFNQEEFNFVKEVVDIILPPTKSKSASKVNTHLFLDEVFDKCLNEDQQTLIKSGMAKLISDFSTASDKLQLIVEVDKQAYSGNEEYAYFQIIKQFTLVGFFTSKEGETVASNYVKFPGDYIGEIPVNEETLNYGNTSLRYYL